MTSSWSTIPEKNLHRIFSYCTYHELKNLSLVCKSWHAQFDLYVRDKIWLCADKIMLNSQPHEFLLTKRTFEKLRISNYIVPIEPYIKDTLNPVTQIRDTHMKFKHLHIDIEDYRILPEILGSVGFIFTHLTLNVKDEKSVDESLLRECKSFRKLTCVKHLKIIGFSPEFEKLFKHFKDLKSLEWESSQEMNPYRQVMYSAIPESMEGAKTGFTALRKNLVRTLLEASPNIEELSLLNITKSFVDLDVLKTLKCLKKFRTNVPGLWKQILDNKSPIEFLEIGGSHIRDRNLLLITTNFKQLKTLGIGFMDYAPSENVLKEIWTMPNLRYIHFDSLKVSNSNFISNLPNITTLKLNGIELSVDFIAHCSKATPNVTFAEMNSIQDGVNFRFFQEMAFNWKKLHTLNVRLQTKVKFTERDLRVPLIATPSFENLRNLLLQTDFVTVPFQFFKSFKAPNLKRATFDLDAGRPKDEKSNKIVPFILANSPYLEDLKFRSCLNLNHDSIRVICKTLKNLKSLTFVECGSLRVGIVRDILKISKGIQYVNIYYVEEIGEIIDFRVKEHMANKFLRFGQVAKKVETKNNPEKKYEMAVENLCKARIPNLTLYKGDGLTRILRGNNVEVILAKGVDLYKYDSALDSYSDNLKRTFDDIYENVFRPQFKKCGEEEFSSDEGTKSPRSVSKKKNSVCPSKTARNSKKDDKENVKPSSPQALVVKENISPKKSPNILKESISTNQIESSTNTIKDIDDAIRAVQEPETKSNIEDPDLLNPPSMKVLAERKFAELPTDIKLKQLEKTGNVVVESEKSEEFKVPITPSQKKKSTGTKIRDSMVSFMSPKLKKNVLKSPIVKRFSLQKSAIECSKALEEIENIASKAVKTPQKVKFDIKEETETLKAPMPTPPPRKEKRKSKSFSKDNTQRDFNIPEITITVPSEDEESTDPENETIVLEEDTKYISRYYEFSDVETEDEFFDCEDFDNTITYASLCK